MYGCEKSEVKINKSDVCISKASHHLSCVDNLGYTGLPLSIFCGENQDLIVLSGICA